MQVFLKKTKTTDTYKNLAYEQGLIKLINDKACEGEEMLCLFLWQSKDSVVVGRHQNISRECNLEIAKAHGTDIVRRTTGGGAVYHDLGNLCFTIVATDNVFDKEKNFEILLRVLKNLNINAELSGRNDILVDGKKISGSAYTTSKRACLHHGTFLVNEDVDFASKVLTPSEFKLKSKGVTSVRSRILNLCELNRDITVELLEDEIFTEFEMFFKQTNLIDGDSEDKLEEILDQEYISNYESLLKSESFIDINGSKTGIEVNDTFGTFRFSIEEKDGRIKRLVYETDAIENQLLEAFAGSLVDVKIVENEIFKAYEEFLQNGEKNLEISFSEKKMLDRIIVAIVNSIPE